MGDPGATTILSVRNRETLTSYEIRVIKATLLIPRRNHSYSCCHKYVLIGGCVRQYKIPPGPPFIVWEC